MNGIISDDEFEMLLKQSILGVIYSQEELRDMLAICRVEACDSEDVVCEKGESPEFLIIPITAELELFTSKNNIEIANGTISSGRSLNIYSILRNEAYQYSARAKNSGTILKVPSSIINQKLEENLQVKNYFHKVTEDQNYQRIAKDIESIGCSREFKLHFISALEMNSIKPQQWLYDPGEVPSFAFYLVSGQLVSQNISHVKDKKPLQLIVPEKLWVGWQYIIEDKPFKNLILSLRNSNYISLSKSSFLNLTNQFPEEMNLLSEAVSSGLEKTLSEEIQDEEVDIEELINQNPSKKKQFWQKYPWIQQHDQMDCGPACLAMISKYYDHGVPIQFWRNQLQTNQEGTSIHDMAATSEKFGFTARALACEDIETLDEGFFPVIAVRKYHYLVIYEVNSKGVVLADPQFGILKMSLEEFYDGFEQAILFLRPTESFYLTPIPTARYKHFLHLLRGLHKEIALNFIISLMLVVLGLFAPILSQIFFDDVLVKKDFNLFKVTILAASGLLLINGLLNWSRAYYANHLATKFNFNAHGAIIKKMLGLKYKYFADRHVGDFTGRLNEIEKIRHFFLSSMEQIILSILSFTIYSTALFIYSPKVALLVGFAIPGFLIISWIAGKMLSKEYQKIFKEHAEINSYITDVVKGILTVKSTGAELASRWRYEERLIRLLKAEKSYFMTQESLDVFSGIYSQLINYSVMGLAAYIGLRGELSPGQVVALTMLAGATVKPVAEFARHFGDVNEMFCVFDRLNDILLAPVEKSVSRGHFKKEKLRGDIEFKDVWFSFGGESSAWVLKGVSFKIEAGSHVALVGPSGSGKSTVAALLSRMFVPTKGQILIDDRDYLDYDLDWLRSQMGILHQENHLFSGPIFENISFSDPSIDMQKVEKSAQRAVAEEFILKKPLGYQYQITAGGFGLSGGEKQRLALARALHKDPQIFILDEATSALDGISESKLMSNMSVITKNLTTLNIAHRYSTIKYSEFALVLHEGRVAGFGSIQDLEKENEIFKKLFISSGDVIEKIEAA